MDQSCVEVEKFNSHFDGPVVPDEQVINPISDSMSTTVGLFFKEIDTFNFIG